MTTWQHRVNFQTPIIYCRAVNGYSSDGAHEQKSVEESHFDRGNGWVVSHILSWYPEVMSAQPISVTQKTTQGVPQKCFLEISASSLYCNILFYK